MADLRTVNFVDLTIGQKFWLADIESQAVYLGLVTEARTHKGTNQVFIDCANKDLARWWSEGEDLDTLVFEDDATEESLLALIALIPTEEDEGEDEAESEEEASIVISTEVEDSEGEEGENGESENEDEEESMDEDDEDEVTLKDIIEVDMLIAEKLVELVDQIADLNATIISFGESMNNRLSTIEVQLNAPSIIPKIKTAPASATTSSKSEGKAGKKGLKKVGTK